MPAATVVDFSWTPPGLTVAEENALAGDALPTLGAAGGSTGAGDTTNLGFAREFSVNAGETIHFSCHGTGTDIDIYRVGWYGGDGARIVDSITNTATSQPNPQTITGSNSGTACTNWSTTASWAVPADATSGFYVGVLWNTGHTNSSQIPFVVRRDDRNADVMLKVSDTTWATAYNHYGTPADPLGGRSLYAEFNSSGVSDNTITNRCHAVTYHKPVVTRAGSDKMTHWMAHDAPLIRWLERMGYDLAYSASKDWRASGPILADCDVYISTGHDEYWSQSMRDAWEGLRDAGKHLLFMSGNEVFWRIRFGDEHGQGGNADTYWCYKDTHDGPGVHDGGDVLDPVTWTGTYQDTRQPGGADPQSYLTGTYFRMNGENFENVNMLQSSPICDHQVWRHTTTATTGFAVNSLIGFEADEMDPQQLAANRATLCATTVNIDGFWTEVNGQFYNGNGSIDWGVVAQRYSSGAVVVGFGTTGWAFGLDDGHDQASSVANTKSQQFTTNLLCDLGADAATPHAGLTVPTAVSLDNYGQVP